MTANAKQALIMATLAFAANFSVWTLFAVLGVHLAPTLDISATQYGLLISAPIITGALLRLPAGILCQYFSTKKLFVIQMACLIPPLMMLNHINSFQGYVIAGLLLGISGVSFTIGISYVSAWFESKQQGTAMGIFGAGNSGAAITLLLTPLVIEHLGLEMVGPVFSLGTIVMILLFIWLAPSSEKSIQKSQPRYTHVAITEHLKPLKSANVWMFGLYYYFVFGSFLALLLWLPQYYIDVYKLSLSQAMAWTLVFATTSSLIRAIGGWYADQYGGRSVNWSVFWICIVCLFFLSYPPTTMVIHGVEKDVPVSFQINLWVFNLLILIVGLAQGFGRASVYKIINDYYPYQMGSVGGAVAMIGALGGFTLPILFGLAIDIGGVHTACFMLLYGLCAACMIVMYFAMKSEKYKHRMEDALNNDFLIQIRKSNLIK